MKKTLTLLASLSLVFGLTGCPSETPTTPEVTPEATETDKPEETPETPEETETPETPAPVETTEPAVTPEAPENALPVEEVEAEFGITGASSTEVNFKFDFVISGTGIGSADDYEFLQIKVSSFTAPLVQNGEVRSSGDASDIAINNDSITFTWRGQSPTANDEVQISFKKKDGEEGSSSKVRLSTK